MKFILELVLTGIIMFFVWNILKRLFFKTFYSYLFKNIKQNNTQQNTNKPTKDNPKIHWDAETVDYEEVKDSKDKR